MNTSSPLETVGRLARWLVSNFLPFEVGWIRSAISLFLFGSFVYVVMSYLAAPRKKSLREALKAEQERRQSHFKKIREELAADGANEEAKEKRHRITGLSFFQLKDDLQAGRLTAVEAVDAFRWKSFECQEKFNCVVEFVRDAVELARQLDSEYADGGKPKPPLFGMPFSVKENFYLKGYDCTLGLAKFLGEPMTEENSMVAHLRTLGAIPIVRTNVPQTCISFMCSNTLYGTTGNPHDVTRTPGGSSGGEGCIVAAGGVPFGTGSDVGGSLRIPAHFCGLITIKPTSNRPKVLGGHPGIPGVTKMALSYSYFTKEVDSLAFLLRSTLVPEYFARIPQCAPIPFDLDVVTSAPDRRFRIGYYDEDGWFPSTPACKRAVQEAKHLLESLGHELVPFVIPDPSRAISMITKSLFPDNGAFFADLLRDEEVDENLKMSKSLLSMPLAVRWMAARMVAPFDPKASVGIDAYVRDLNDLRANYEQVDEYIKQFIVYWQSLGLDGLLGTVLPFPALPHDGPSKFSHGAFGTLLYNMLDFPAAVIPVTRVSDEDERAMSEYPTKVAAEASIQHPLNRMLRKAMEKSRGLPVGVQVITLPYKEELCLKILHEIESGLKSIK